MRINKNLIYPSLSVLVVTVLLSILLSVHTPFVWTPTLSTKSEEPFGCKLFDELMTRSLPMGYEVLDELPDSLDATRDAILYSKFSLGIYSRGYDNAKQETARGHKLYDFASKQGGKVIVAVSQTNLYDDSLLISFGLNKPKNPCYYQQYYEIIEPSIERQKQYDVAPRCLTVLYDRRRIYVNELLVAGNNFSYGFSSKLHKSLIEDEGGNPIAFVRRFKSGGEIYYVAAPLLFSNYGANDAQTRSIIVELLSPVANRRVMRIMGKNTPVKTTFAGNDQFIFLHKHPSLNAAFNLFIAILTLALLFFSRRRMRAIPLPPKEHNMTLDFAKTIGTFHYRRHNRKLLQKSEEEKEENELKQESK